MKRSLVKGRIYDAQLQIFSQLPQEFGSSCLFFMICSLRCWAMSLTIPDWFTQKQYFHSRRGRVLPFQLSVGLALSFSVKPPQPGSRVGPVMKSTAIILIRNRGQGSQWKSIDILIAESSSFCHAQTSQLLVWLEQGSVSFVGEGCCL